MILGASKEQVESRLGRPQLGRSLLDMPGEKAWSWRVGDFEMTVSFLDGIARAMAVRRRSGPHTALTPAELAGVLALNAPAALWTIQAEPQAPTPSSKSSKARGPVKINAKGPSRYFTLAERDSKSKDRVVREIFGFSPAGAPFAFFYLPAAGDAVPVLPSEAAVIGKLR